MAEAPAVSVNVPTVSKLLTVDISDELIDEVQQIAVPFAMLTKVVVFMPPGTNYSVGVGIGFNGVKLLPTESADDFIYGSGFKHEFPLAIPVQNVVDVFFRHLNLYPHRIFIGLYMDYAPIQAVRGSSPFKMTPR